MHTVSSLHSTNAPYNHSDKGQASIPISLILFRHGAIALTSGTGSLAALPSHTSLPFASTMQIDVVLSDTSSPTNNAIGSLPLLLSRIKPSHKATDAGGRDRITPAHATGSR